MKLTKIQMVKDIFFLATEGQRTADNYVQGMGLIEAVADHNYRDIIQMAWNKTTDVATAKAQMRTLSTLTYYNLPLSHRDWFHRDRSKFSF